MNPIAQPQFNLSHGDVEWQLKTVGAYLEIRVHPPDFVFRRYMMKNLALRLKKFLKNEDGPTAVEYAVMLSLIIVLCLTAVKTIGQNARTTFNGVAAQISTDQNK